MDSVTEYTGRELHEELRRVVALAAERAGSPSRPVSIGKLLSSTSLRNHGARIFGSFAGLLERAPKPQRMELFLAELASEPAHATHYTGPGTRAGLIEEAVAESLTRRYAAWYAELPSPNGGNVTFANSSDAEGALERMTDYQGATPWSELRRGGGVDDLGVVTWVKQFAGSARIRGDYTKATQACSAVAKNAVDRTNPWNLSDIARDNVLGVAAALGHWSAFMADNRRARIHFWDLTQRVGCPVFRRVYQLIPANYADLTSPAAILRYQLAKEGPASAVTAYDADLNSSAYQASISLVARGRPMASGAADLCGESIEGLLLSKRDEAGTVEDFASVSGALAFGYQVDRRFKDAEQALDEGAQALGDSELYPFRRAVLARRKASLHGSIVGQTGFND